MNKDDFESDNPELRQALEDKELSDKLENEELVEALENKTLADFAFDERIDLARELIREQIADQRIKLHRWRNLTKQPAQIDTGYIGQHLVSLVSGIEGGGFRGKGNDLIDGSEVKSADFLDSLDARGAVAPRWNFTSTTKGKWRVFYFIQRYTSCLWT